MRRLADFCELNGFASNCISILGILGKTLLFGDWVT